MRKKSDFSLLLVKMGLSFLIPSLVNELNVRFLSLIRLYTSIMGCSFCHNPSSTLQSSRSPRQTLSIPLDHYSDGPRKSVSQTKEIKLSRSNYVLMSSARLSDTYQIDEKIGEGG